MKKARKQKEWKIAYDADVDVLYLIRRSGAIEETKEAAPGVNLEFARNKELVGIEILDASRLLKPALKSMETTARR